MAKKKGTIKKQLTEQQLNLHLVDIAGKVRAMEYRLWHLIKYTEYIACTVDSSVNYTEHLAGLLSKRKLIQTIGNFDITSSDGQPTFIEFTKLQKEKDDAEIPF
jgi:hypothetical protein